MSKVTPIDEEYLFEGSIMISQTDLDGAITFVNRKYCDVSGYSVDELLGKEHNIVKHPEMPNAAFSKMWDSISSGHTWNGLLKNLRKDGLYYWTSTEILPITDDDNNVTGFISANKSPSRKDIEDAHEIYTKMYQDQ